MTKTLWKKLLGVALVGAFAAMPLMGSAQASVLFPHHRKHHHHHHHHHHHSVIVVHHHH